MNIEIRWTNLVSFSWLLLTSCLSSMILSFLICKMERMAATLQTGKIASNTMAGPQQDRISMKLFLVVVILLRFEITSMLQQGKCI